MNVEKHKNTRWAHVRRSLGLASFDEYVGFRANFFGVDDRKFKLDSSVFEPLEEIDDYRSFFCGVETVVLARGGLFFRRPLDEVVVTSIKTNNFDGYQLVADDGHVWLRFGSDDYESWYPMFVFNYYPRGCSVPDL